jgi:hypothetical protein
VAFLAASNSRALRGFAACGLGSGRPSPRLGALTLSLASVLFATGCAFMMAMKGPPATPPTLDPDLVQRGAMLFNDSRVSGDGSRACATCHPGGGTDWNVYQDGTLVQPGPQAGWRTLTLRGVWQTAPYLWDNTATTISGALDRMLAIEMLGGRLEGRDRQALEEYVLSIPAFDRGRAQPDGTPIEPVTLSARRGFEIARDNCFGCHKPPAYVRLLRYDVGSQGQFGVPTLRGLVPGGPYGHDGRWPDLPSAIRNIIAHEQTPLTDAQIANLIEYLKLL